MNVSLTPELEQLVNDRVRSGLYQTASEVVREALRLLKQRDEDHAALRSDVLSGLVQLDQGHGRRVEPGSADEFASTIKTRGRARLASGG